MATLVHSFARPAEQPRCILGIDFFAGNAAQAIERMSRGGLLVVPAAPALLALAWDPDYREALSQADLCIPDSSYMVLIWNLIQRDVLGRLSGLEYLTELLHHEDLHEPGSTVWIMPSPESAARNVIYLRQHGIHVPGACLYVAPFYETQVEDPALLALLDRAMPRHIIVAIGGGTQEKLGLYLKQHLLYRPSIHCIGAAIGFLSGDQVYIPKWADQFCMGWAFRCVSRPGTFIPRYWNARKLLSLLLRYRSNMPPLMPSKT